MKRLCMRGGARTRRSTFPDWTQSAVVNAGGGGALSFSDGVSPWRVRPTIRDRCPTPPTWSWSRERPLFRGLQDRRALQQRAAMTLTEAGIIDFARQRDPQPFHIAISWNSARKWSFGGLRRLGPAHDDAWRLQAVARSRRDEGPQPRAPQDWARRSFAPGAGHDTLRVDDRHRRTARLRCRSPTAASAACAR